ncbi:DNA-processing protein DprA [Kineococcus gynurae]|uniref:DNA-processing protein DprA n=1 Tax=Kineococcus gynurae TaxID=452979 RepID=A0ABV5LVL8_9ACTN
MTPRDPGPLRSALDDERLARAAWSRLAEPGDAAAAALVAEVGASTALHGVLDGRGPQRWRSRLEVTDPEADLAAHERLGGRLLVPGDEEWPDGLQDLTPEVGDASSAMTRPFCLWVRGPLPVAETLRRSVSLVGTRAPTAYGSHVAAELGAGLSERGRAVVSGGAFGVDATVHRAALAVGGATVAVLACGVDRAYPAANSALLARLAEEGLVLGEAPPGTSPTRWRFLERNRIIAALSAGTVVVEAAWRSGALSTAERAERMSRVVGAVPGPVTSAASAGCHRLLRERGASLVTGTEDVLDLLGRVGEGAGPGREVERRPFDGLRREELQVAESLPRRRAAGVERIAQDAGLDVDHVHAVLGRLELAGIAVRSGTGYRLGTA